MLLLTDWWNEAATDLLNIKVNAYWSNMSTIGSGMTNSFWTSFILKSVIQHPVILNSSPSEVMSFWQNTLIYKALPMIILRIAEDLVNSFLQVIFKILIDQILTLCLALCLAAIQFLGASFSWCSAIHPFIWHPHREANGQQRDKSEMCLGKILHLLPRAAVYECGHTWEM